MQSTRHITVNSPHNKRVLAFSSVLSASDQGKYESVEGSVADPGFRDGSSPGRLGGSVAVVVIEESPCPRGSEGSS